MNTCKHPTNTIKYIKKSQQTTRQAQVCVAALPTVLTQLDGFKSSFGWLQNMKVKLSLEFSQLRGEEHSIIAIKTPLFSFFCRCESWYKHIADSISYIEFITPSFFFLPLHPLHSPFFFSLTTTSLSPLFLYAKVSCFSFDFLNRFFSFDIFCRCESWYKLIGDVSSI